MKIKVTYGVDLPILKHINGITLYPFIFIRYDELDFRTHTIVKHEMVHIEQIKRIGFIKFYLLYIYYHIKYGYWNNPFEIEAYRRQYE